MLYPRHPGGISGQIIDLYDEAVIVQRGQPEENEQRIRFQQKIHGLTLQVKSIEVDETIKPFITKFHNIDVLVYAYIRLIDYELAGSLNLI